MNLSDFGQRMSADAGILELMDNLGKALDGGNFVAKFGGGNPAQIPGVTAIYKDIVQKLVEDDSKFTAMLGNYDAPQGNRLFIEKLVTYFNTYHNLSIGPENIAITPGSQAGFFLLFNLLAGKAGAKTQKILFPLVPEYIGYADQTIEPDVFTSFRPKIELYGDHEFRYCIDFDQLNVTDDISAICVSRPTNPSGKTITDEEIQKLSQLALKHDIPLIIDSAYGQPFPGITAAQTKLFWKDHMVLSMSLSKLGLPGARVGIFIGPPALMGALTSANAIVALANPNIGQYIGQSLLTNNLVGDITEQHLKPYYADRARKAHQLLFAHLPMDLPWRLHTYEGSYFFWLWLDGMKLTSKQVYEQLRAKGVLVVSGEYFFFGHDTSDWPHASQCLRINFARPDQELEEGIPILAEVIANAYT